MQPNKSVVFVVGRFNPPTKGHEKLFFTAFELSVVKNADFFIFPSKTEGKSRNKLNPLKFERKLQLMKLLMPWIDKFIINDSNLFPNPWNVMEYLHNQGYTKIYLVAGSDRLHEYNVRWKRAAETKFEHVEVLSSGNRDGNKGISSISSSKTLEAYFRDSIEDVMESSGWDLESSLLMMRFLDEEIRR